MSTQADNSEATVRRIVTGHDSEAKAIFVSDGLVARAALAEDDGRMGAAFFHVWKTAEMPVDVSESAMATQQQGSQTTAAGTGGGSVLRIGVLPPGMRSPMHRTQSLDYGICLEGKCDLELDSGESVSLHTGDVVIQRGTNHAWHNRSDAPCRLAWILLDAEPPVVGGQSLGSSWETAGRVS